MTGLRMGVMDTAAALEYLYASVAGKRYVFGAGTPSDASENRLRTVKRRLLVEPGRRYLRDYRDGDYGLTGAPENLRGSGYSLRNMYEFGAAAQLSGRPNFVRPLNDGCGAFFKI